MRQHSLGLEFANLPWLKDDQVTLTQVRRRRLCISRPSPSPSTEEEVQVLVQRSELVF